MLKNRMFFSGEKWRDNVYYVYVFYGDGKVSYTYGEIILYKHTYQSRYL